MTTSLYDKLDKILQEQISNNPNQKIKVVDIARAAGISHSTIYNRYKNIHTIINEHNIRITKPIQINEMKKLAEQKTKMAIMIDEQTICISKLISLNATYEIENTKLKARILELEDEILYLKTKFSNITLIK